ncbi:DUF1801 domain-containing protein [Yoonia sp. I 8.24]|uniref:DUF1801 domain-containing protein n=1 Tax=Yoonia sp. I 8.24 TaxID=1537229 RepID=UPI001EDD18F5|nr:DUF1801 domain-containing protein [Yoonia sp. I 8.24]MCG3268661.1 DUF1801 domain-containing protein [Yoonia sp. I 8.24]
MNPIVDPKVQAAFDAFPIAARETAMILRGLIFDEAAQNNAVGALHETLKWGQPAYLTAASKSGTTLRIGVPKSGGCAIYAHCATTVISKYAETFAGLDMIEGNRAVLFATADDVVPDRLRLLIRHALTYHL